MGSDTLAAVDRDVLSRFATCCRALGLTVHDRRRPADLAGYRIPIDERLGDRLAEV
jgi:hypothetical protein